jgi:hypothetical protein
MREVVFQAADVFQTEATEKQNRREVKRALKQVRGQKREALKQVKNKTQRVLNKRWKEGVQEGSQNTDGAEPLQINSCIQLPAENTVMACPVKDSRAREPVSMDHYDKIKPVKVIAILNFEPGGKADELQNDKDVVVHGDLAERKSKSIIKPLLMSLTYVVLPRFEKILGAQRALNFTGDPLAEWLYLMTRAEGGKVNVTRELVAEDDAVADGYRRLSHLSRHEQARLTKQQETFAAWFSREDYIKVTSREEGREEGAIGTARTMLLEPCVCVCAWIFACMIFACTNRERGGERES